MEARRREFERFRERRMTDLRTSGELLRRAEEIRALVARVEHAMLREDGPAISSEQVAQRKSWALAQTDELDPVISAQVLSYLHVPELDDGQTHPDSGSEACAAPNADSGK